MGAVSNCSRLVFKMKMMIKYGDNKKCEEKKASTEWKHGIISRETFTRPGGVL